MFLHSTILSKDLENMLSKSFTELNGITIVIDYSNIVDCFLEWGYIGDDYYIDVDFSFREGSYLDAMIGGIVHELCHIVIEINLKKRGHLSLDNFCYKLISRYRYLDERDTDLETVIRGYGKQLLAFSKFRDQHCHIKGYTSDHNDCGLSTSELMKLLNEK